ncbi:hypothetical protein RN001_014711 [Aquatica leii]|uniref:G-protein coupled receptors family 2 profile 2 domain-containing protein n=1 Tax=Aquatica leii TaxID=1421715 RepID=A0AAN7NY56_9COLE|nr:hypothetical protein RN001_014711 [Aquatica leii]
MQCVYLMVIICSVFFDVSCDTIEVSLANARPDCVCDDLHPCIRKCCNPNHIIPDEAENCTDVGVDEFKINITGETSINAEVCYKYGVMNCTDNLNFYRLSPNEFDEDKYEIRSDGKLWTTNLKTLHDSDEYCVENFEDIGISVYLCIRAELMESSSVYALGMIVSLPFLFVTFLVHMLLPVKTIYIKCLIGFVLSLFFAYLTLVTIEYYRDFDRTICYVVGMFCVLSFMLSFWWTNAMSLDIWLTFSGKTQGFGRNRQKAERKRFLIYFAYTSILSIIHIIIILSLSIWGDPEAWYNPLFGEDKCWFQGNVGVMLYFYGPLACILILNVIFFGLTAWKIRQTQKETAVLRKGDSKSSSDDDKRFKVFLKLLLAMGGNWSLEVISFICEWQIGDVPVVITYLVDFCNVLYGVVIFFLFTFKKAHWVQLKKSYACLNKIKMPQICQRKKADAVFEEVPLS